MTGREVRSWTAEKLEPIFGVYLIWQGLSIQLTGRTGERTASFHYLVGLSNLTDIPPGWILSMLFFVPGVLIVNPRSRKFGLLVAAMFMLLHAVGTARSVILSVDGAITAPNTYLFIAFLAAWLYASKRNSE
jgi:hypothetical protein